MKHICKNCIYFLKMNNGCDNDNLGEYCASTFKKDSSCLGYEQENSEYTALYVGENFGCIHWKKKESEENEYI